MKKTFILIFLIFLAVNAFAQTHASQARAFNDIFPNLNQEIRSAAFTDSGYVRSSQKAGGFVILGNQSGSGLDPKLVRNVLNKNPGYFVESILVIPSTRPVSLLDIYNALGNVRDLKGRLYNSATRNEMVPLFEDATRIVSEKNTNAINDPAPKSILPLSEIVYIRLRDVNFGNTFYKGEIEAMQNGIRYTMSNFRNMTYLFVPVIREDKFVAQLYIEPIQEGILIYSVAGADISDFFASRIHVDSAISKRLAVITSWAADGITKKR